MPTLSQLKVFLAALEQGSVTGAAGELELSQSAVSHALASLERELGAKLLERGRFGARATPLGERVARHVRAMLQAEAALRQEVHLEAGTLEGTVRLASFRSIATHLLPDLLAHFRERYPRVTLELQSLEGVAGGIERALLEGRAEVGLLTPPVSEALSYHPFAADEWVAVFPAGQAPAPQAQWADLERLPFLLCNEAGAPAVRAYWEAHGRTLRPTAQVLEDSVILSMVAHGFGVSMLARLAVEPVPEGVAVCALPERLERPFGAAVRPALETAPVVRAVLGALRDPQVWASSAVVQRGLVRLEG